MACFVREVPHDVLVFMEISVVVVVVVVVATAVLTAQRCCNVSAKFPPHALETGIPLALHPCSFVLLLPLCPRKRLPNEK